MTDKFNDILVELRNLHEKKSQDYGTDGDPYANVRASAEFGIAPWIGALIRENDKTTRIKSFIVKGTLANESLEDSLIDKAVYSIIALLLYREENDGGVLRSNAIVAPMHQWYNGLCRRCGLVKLAYEASPLEIDCITP